MEAPPRLLEPDRRRSKGREAAVIAAVLAFAALTDPDRPLPFEVCGFKWLTGLPCPTCGLTRALCHAVHGQWAESVASHPAGLIVAAGLAGWMAWSALEAVRGRPLAHTVRNRLAGVSIGAGLLVSLVFWAVQLSGRL
jgi:hypothetical protein